MPVSLMKKAIQSFFILPLSSFILLATGCGTLWTMTGQYAGTERMLAQGDFAAAAAQIERSHLTHYGSKDRVLYHLDLGLLQHYLGDYEASNRSLDEAEQAMEKAFTKSVTRAAASMLLNDNALEYAGEDYEGVYLNLFKALNYIALDRFNEAFVEVRRIDEKLKRLEDRHWEIAEEYNRASESKTVFEPDECRFQNSALGRWLSMLLYRAEGRPDEALIDLKKISNVWKLQPSMVPFDPPDLSDALSPPAKGGVRVSFLGFCGQAPEKKADTLWIHTQKDQIFIGSSATRTSHRRMGVPDVIYWSGIDPGYTFKFEMPGIEKRGSAVRRISVLVDGKQMLTLEPIERLENAAVEAFEARKPLVYLKTITRAVVKGIAAAQAQKAAEEKWGEMHGLLAGLLSGAAVGASENADLRISRFFPAAAYIGELDIPPGTHEINVVYTGYGGAVLYTDRIGDVEIREDGLNLIESFYLN